MEQELGRVIGIGETVYDIIFKDDQPLWAVPGGSTFNAMISLGRAGVLCDMVTEVGDDHVADLICQYLYENGVSDTYVHRHMGTKSHLSLAFLDENNDAHYTFYKDHAHVRMQEVDLQIKANDVVLFGSFFAINPAIREAVRGMLMQAQQVGATLYYDVNFRAAHVQDIPNVLENIEENMRMASVVRGSLEDFGYLYNLTDVDTIYEQHIQPNCTCFICTNGGKSIELRTPSLRASFPVAKIETVSTVGAGDNFNAGLIYALRNLGERNMKALPLKEWTGLIVTGQLFAQDVCRRLSNSISKDLLRNR